MDEMETLEYRIKLLEKELDLLKEIQELKEQMEKDKMKYVPQPIWVAPWCQPCPQDWKPPITYYYDTYTT